MGIIGPFPEYYFQEGKTSVNFFTDEKLIYSKVTFSYRNKNSKLMNRSSVALAHDPISKENTEFTYLKNRILNKGPTFIQA